jgi:hypothetical protein
MARMGCSVVDAQELRFTSQPVSCPRHSDANSGNAISPGIRGLMRSGVACLGKARERKSRPKAAQFNDRGSSGHQGSFRLPAIRREADAREAEQALPKWKARGRQIPEETICNPVRWES